MNFLPKIIFYFIILYDFLPVKLEINRRKNNTGRKNKIF